jgi:uncharacterized membrane protein YkvA (DUF1232 family)
MSEKFAVTRSVGRIAGNFGVAASLLRDYWKGSYREVPWYFLLAMIVTILYVFNPLDLIPDVLPVIGLIDDALIVAVCLALLEKDLRKYADWKENKH